MVESTYGDQMHPAPEDEDLLAAAITRTAERGGTCLLPTFAVDRTPLVVHTIDRCAARAESPADVPVYVDSPMALRAWEVYRSALTAGDPQFRSEPRPGGPGVGPERHPGPPARRLRAPQPPVPPLRESSPRPAWRPAGGSCTISGRSCPTRATAWCLTGFQVAGTRGQALADGARQLKIQGHYVPVRAEVVSLHGFSAHADATQMVRWLSRMPRAGGGLRGARPGGRIGGACGAARARSSTGRPWCPASASGSRWPERRRRRPGHAGRPRPCAVCCNDLTRTGRLRAPSLGPRGTSVRGRTPGRPRHWRPQSPFRAGPSAGTRRGPGQHQDVCRRDVGDKGRAGTVGHSSGISK